MGAVISFLSWCLATYLLLVGQMAICPLVAVGPIEPQLFVALLLPCLVLRNHRSSILRAAVWGLSADSLGSAPLGVNLLSFTVAAVLLSRRTQHGTNESAPVTLLWMALSIIALLTIDLLASWPLEKLVAEWTGAGVLLAGTALYTFLISIGWMTMVSLVRRVAGDRRGMRSMDGGARHTAVGW